MHFDFDSSSVLSKAAADSLVKKSHEFIIIILWLLLEERDAKFPISLIWSIVIFLPILRPSTSSMRLYSNSNLSSLFSIPEIFPEELYSGSET